MVLPVVPADKRVFIRVAEDRAIVSRYLQTSPHQIFTTQPATNWPDLEDEAIQVVEEAGGAIWHSGDYPCPDDLAARATWPDTSG